MAITIKWQTMYRHAAFALSQVVALCALLEDEGVIFFRGQTDSLALPQGIVDGKGINGGC